MCSRDVRIPSKYDQKIGKDDQIPARTAGMSRIRQYIIRKYENVIRITGVHVQNMWNDDQIPTRGATMIRFCQNMIRKCEIVIRISVEMIRIQEKMIKFQHAEHHDQILPKHNQKM